MLLASACGGSADTATPTTTTTPTTTAVATPVASEIPVIDAHSHVASGVSAELLSWALDDVGVDAIVLFARRGSSNQDVLDIAEELPGRVIPGIGFQQAGWLAQEPEFIDDVERNLDTGRFQWMGELLLRHYGVPELDADAYDFSPDTDLFRRVLDLSARYRVPLTVHHESEQETRELFKEVLIDHPEAIVVWAHWCGRSTADEAREFLEQLPNLHCDTGASGVSRRYGREKNPLFVSQLVWDPDWRDLIEEMPDRFLFAVDAVVAVHYSKYGNLIKEYPRAFDALSDEARPLMLGGNALRLMSSVVSPFEAPTTTTGAPEELAAICTFDESVPKISCQAAGTTQGSQLRWESNVYGWKTGTSYEVELVEQYQLVSEVVVTLQECQGSDCELVTTKIDTSAIAQTPSTTESGDYGGDTSTADSPTSTTSENAELAAVCSFDNVQHRLTCEASGGRGGSLAWSSDAPSFGTDAGLTYSRQLEWGLVLDRIEVNLEECLGSDCSTVTSTVELSLQPRGDCPNSFDGWLETFPLSDLSVITEVEAPARIIGPVLEQPGIFRLPYWQNEVQIRLPIDATLIYGLKYLLVSNLNDANPDEVPDVQYGLRFETECEGLWFAFEHMYELSPEILPYFADVPTQEAATAHRIGPLAMSEGDLVGTSIGFPRDGNAFVAFGVFDDYERVPTAGPDFINAACYYDFFSPEVAAQLRTKTVTRWPVAGDFCP